MSYYHFKADDGSDYGSFEVFYNDGFLRDEESPDRERLADGWYWWACFPGCIPDSDPHGPFDTEDEARKDAQDD